MTDQQLVKEDYYWSDAVKRDFVEHYYHSGSILASATHFGIPYDTAKRWKPKDWFKEQYQELEEAETRVRQRRLAKLVDRSLDRIEETLEVGEERLTARGEIKNVKPSLSSLTVAVGVMVDKSRAIKQEAPKAEDTADQILARLADRLRASVTTLPPAKVIDVEATEVDPINAGCSPDRRVSESLPP